MAHRIELKRSAAKVIRTIPQKKERARVATRIAALAEAPRPPGCTKLSEQEAYRVRQGDYRIVYTVKDEALVVEVVRVGHRWEVVRVGHRWEVDR